MADNRWVRLERWLRTPTGQEFLDECVYGTVGFETMNALLRSENITVNEHNRRRLLRLADMLLTEEGV